MKLEKKEDEIEKRNKNSIPNFLSNSSLKLNRVEVGSTWFNRLGKSKGNPINRQKKNEDETEKKKEVYRKKNINLIFYLTRV